MPDRPVAPGEQLPLLPLTTTEPPSLSALIQRARVEATKASEGGAVGAIVGRLAREDGTASVAVLLSEGFPEAAIAAAVSPAADDKRVKPRAKLGLVGGEPFLWLTTTGWQAAGKPSRRERAPSAESAEHAAAPLRLEAWLSERLSPFPGLSVSVVTGDPCRAFSERVKALAWARISGAGDATGDAGVLTGGLVPDALLVERFPDDRTYAGAWGHLPTTAEDAAEQTVALECEFSPKSDAPLRWKVDRWSAALSLGAAHAVVWVVRSNDVADRLRALGVGKADSRQLLVPAVAVGLEGHDCPEWESQWWPLRVTPA